ARPDGDPRRGPRSRGAAGTASQPREAEEGAAAHEEQPARAAGTRAAPGGEAEEGEIVPHIVVGTAGHIDHGKSTLVRALTGVDPDRLKEEKARGITIDLGFASWREGDVTVAFVDVPGHERFVRNMLAGAGGIDAVLLLVAADEGVMPQTREHREICGLPGVRGGGGAGTEVDAVERRMAERAARDVQDVVKGG